MNLFRNNSKHTSDRKPNSNHLNFPKSQIASHLDAARLFEQKGDWTQAARSWESYERTIIPEHAEYTSVIIESTFALWKTSRDTTSPALVDAKLTMCVKKITASLDSRSLSNLSRTALFKALDIILATSKNHLAPILILQSGIDLEQDPELRNKYLAEHLHVPSSCKWIWRDNITKQRISLFNNIILSYCVQNASQDGIVPFLALRRYAALCLAAGEQPSINFIIEQAGKLSLDSEDYKPVGPSGNVHKISAFMDHSVVDLAASLAIFHPELLRAVVRHSSSDADFESRLFQYRRMMPRYRVITNLSYPMGGGESFMHQTCAMLREFGYENTWISFASDNGSVHKKAENYLTPFYRDVRLTGGLNYDSVRGAVRDHGGDILHTQGVSNEIVAKVAKDIRLPCLVGFHFWTGLVNLGVNANKDIIGNLSSHHAISHVPADNTIVPYVASEFMLDVFKSTGGETPLEVFHPVPDPSHYEISTDDCSHAAFVTQINLAEGKGGRIFAKCVNALSKEKVRFLGVHSEEVGNDLLKEIQKAIQNSPSSQLEVYGPAVEIYARSRVVMIPTLVDETFCRVAYEAAANGIPVISTQAGFISYMLGDTGVYISADDECAWAETIKRFYFDENLRIKVGEEQRKRVIEKFGKYPSKFLSKVINLSTEHISRKSVGFLTAWAEQGLGYQVRTYAGILKRAGFKTHVFSYQPYSARDRSLTSQLNTDDWSAPTNVDSVYYSFNDRENVTKYEVEQFVRARGVGILIVPEICWGVNWDRLASIRSPNLFIFGVPNLETVRRQEVLRHHDILAATLCPTRSVEQILYSHGVKNTHFIGHGYGAPLERELILDKLSRIHDAPFISYLHVGGHNPLSRKRTPEVIKAFIRALEYREDIHLTVTLLDTQGIELPKNDNINYVIGNLDSKGIYDLYKNCDVSIQVSSHEGIGLGFYESIAAATPVISIDTVPHNEVIVDGVCGWLLPAEHSALPDNDDPLSRSANFKEHHLSDLIIRLDRNEICSVTERTALHHRSKFQEDFLMFRLLRVVP